MSRQTFTRFLRNPTEKISLCNVQNEGGVHRSFEQCSKKLQIWWRGASLNECNSCSCGTLLLSLYLSNMVRVWVCLLIRDRKILGRLTKYFEVLKRSRKGNIFFHYSSGTPSMGPWVMEGIRLTSMAEFPFIKSRERREMAWLQTSLSSLPVCLAMVKAKL